MELMKNGYYLCDKFLQGKDLNEILFEIRSVFGTYIGREQATDSDVMRLFENDFDGFHACAHICQKLPSVYRFAGSRRVVAALTAGRMKFPTLNTKPLIAISSKKTASAEAYWKLPAHQDWASNLGSRNGVTIWIPLVDVSTEMGPLEVAPESHLLGALPHTGTPPILAATPADMFWKSVPMKAGDALFLDTFVIHRSGTNVTEDRIRWSLQLRYNDISDPDFIKRKYPVNRTGD
jgi:phytanoyl-CoA hydroxylase